MTRRSDRECPLLGPSFNNKPHGPSNQIPVPKTHSSERVHLKPAERPGGAKRLLAQHYELHLGAAEARGHEGMNDKRAHNNSCFFVTPIGQPHSVERKRSDWLFNSVVHPSSQKNGLSAKRGDTISDSAMIGTNMFRAISESRVCVADLTGLNPNVLYEIGIRHCLSLPIIHIAQIGTELPFDTVSHFTHFYDLSDYGSMRSLEESLSREIGLSIIEDYEVSNPFTQAVGRISVSSSGDSRDQLLARLMDRIEVLENSRSTPSRGTKINREVGPADRLEYFILNRSERDAYNPETFQLDISQVRDNEKIIQDVGNSLLVSKRRNAAELLAIYREVLGEN